MRLSRIAALAVLAGALALILSACGGARPAEETAIAQAPAAALFTATPEPTVTPTVAPVPPRSPLLRHAHCDADPSRTPTPTPTATATPPNPLSVEYMRGKVILAATS